MAYGCTVPPIARTIHIAIQFYTVVVLQYLSTVLFPTVALVTG